MWRLDGATRAEHADAWRALDPAYDGEGPCALVTLLDAPDPAAEWAGPRTLFAGYAPDGRQVRVAYFSAALTRELAGWPLPADAPFEVVPFATQDRVAPDDVVALWTREGALSAAEARRRVDELLLIAVDAGGDLIGVSTRFLQHNAQLGMDVWNLRAFVAASARQSNAATALAVAARDHLEAAYRAGRDTRSAVLLMEVQNAFLKAAFPEPVWRQVSTVLIDETPRGDHVRVYYFAGATVPSA